MNWDMHGLTTALDGFASFLPALIAGLVVLLIGWIVARVLARVTRSLLHRLGFERLMRRMGVGHKYDPEIGSRWAGKAVFFVVMLVTIMQVARIWDLTFVAVGFARLIAYLPHVIGAAAIMGVAILLANWVRDRIARSPTLSSNGNGLDSQMRFLPSGVRIAIIGVGAFMALRELQIAPEIVNAAFMLSLGAVALAGALAFGLGGRDVAGRIAQGWYERRRDFYGRRSGPPSVTSSPTSA